MLIYFVFLQSCRVKSKVFRGLQQKGECSGGGDWRNTHYIYPHNPPSSPSPLKPSHLVLELPEVDPLDSVHWWDPPLPHDPTIEGHDPLFQLLPPNSSPDRWLTTFLRCFLWIFRGGMISLLSILSTNLGLIYALMARFRVDKRFWNILLTFWIYFICNRNT